MTNVREATLDLFRSHGLTTCSVIPARRNSRCWRTFPADFRYVLGLQEMVPAGMADAYAQMTGRPALVQRSRRPGLGNAKARFTERLVEQDPLIVIAGNQRRSMQNTQMPADQHRCRPGAQAGREVGGRTALARESSTAVLAHAIHFAPDPADGAGVRVVADGRLQARTRRDQGRRLRRGGAAGKSPTAVGWHPRWLAWIADLCSHRGRAVTGAGRRVATWSAAAPGTPWSDSPNALPQTACGRRQLPGASRFPRDHPCIRAAAARCRWVGQALTGP